MKPITRKIRVFIIALLSVAAIVLLYVLFFGSPTIRIDTDDAGQDVEMHRVGENAPTFADTRIGGAALTEFRQVDKETGEVKRVFGFEKLLNPRQRGPHMDLLRPYMHLYQGKYKYEIRSDTGMVEVQEVAGTLTPKSARLTQNVTIYIKDKTDPDTILGTIYMEHLDYESDRSQFSTLGPIEMHSEQARLTGRGMTLIYNEPGNRLEYLEIPEIDQIVLMNISDPGSSQSSGQASAPAQTDPASPADPLETTPQNPDPATQDTPEKIYYECELTEDVRIEYGPDIIIDADEKLTLRNILFGDDQSQPDQTPAVSQQNDRPSLADSTGKEAPQKEQPDNDSEEQTIEVVVTCRGAMTIKPMQLAQSSLPAPQRLIELFGTPVRVQQIVTASQGTKVHEVAQCARLAWNMDSEVMSMFTDTRSDKIKLRLDEERSGLETAGHLKWYRANNSARIFGPGKLLRYSDKNTPAQTAIESEMNFQGVMDLFFAQASDPQKTQSFVLKKAQFAGGFQAKVNRESPAYMSASSADFLFDHANRLDQADLRGDVNFISEESGQNSSMRSDQAKLLFKDDNQLRRADMAGDVRLNSPDGSLKTENAQVLFAMDAATGTSTPIMFHATAPSVLETSSSSNEPQKTHLKARRIDYDLVTANAVAAGPVEFSFYPEPSQGQADAPMSSQVPIVITATRNARFFSRQNRAEFHGDVVAERKDIRSEFTQTDTCKGDTLIVNLGPNQGLKDVTMLGEKVFFDTIRKKLSQTISQVRLKCIQLDYDEFSREILAHGPGSIEVNNENAAAKSDDENADRFSLNNPCFARIDGFNQLEWKLDENLLDARAKDQSIHIGYWPIEDGEMGQVVHASSTHVIAEFYQTLEGRNELKKLRAFDGVEYREENANELIGDVLVYLPAEQLITVDGTDNSPCLVNGARVDRIRYHLDTGKITSTIPTTPGALSAP